MEKIVKDIDWDYFLLVVEVKEYGLIDKVIENFIMGNN